MMCMLHHLLHDGHDTAHQPEHAETHVGEAARDPRQIVRARYARGDITEEELRRMLAVLEESRMPSPGGS